MVNGTRMSNSVKISLVLLVLVVYCFSFQGRRGLFDPDEGRYSAVALQMLKTKDWMHPRTHPDHEHWTKPPLTYWAIAASIGVFGKNEFAVRFPNALSFFLTIVASFYLGKIFMPRQPWIVALVFATFLFPATVCNGATTDYPVTLWETWAVCCFVHAYWGTREDRKTMLVLLTWAFFGLAFLTKGPPGLLPLISILIFLRLASPREKKLNMHWISGFLTMLAIGGSWFFMVILERKDLLHYFFWDEFILRVFTGHHERHAQWFAFLYIYIPVLVAGTLPWSFYAGKGVIHVFKKAKEEKSAQCLFLLLWFLVPLVVFSVSKSNLPLYVLPLFVPVAIMTAQEIGHFDFSLKKIRYMMGVWCAGIVLVRLVMAAVPFKKDSSRFAADIKKQYPSFVEEMIFVDTKPALGLQFYTGADIGGTTLKGGAIGTIVRKNRSRLWFVLQDEADGFRKTAGERHIQIREIGPIQAQKSYIFFLELQEKT